MGLPTQATTNAMFTRVEKWLKNIAKEQQINPDIKLLQEKLVLIKNILAYNQQNTFMTTTMMIKKVM